ncbi:hypothetical protein M422DRAFT_781107 [Sphaerobolus stellatus SS14]|uniref:UBC core domain-containing protein n=1 Tax=Sphaerobolus stellatus (strain SS14) TaxID=990650 RepID=A0A0C9U8C5_SPHS4|nr:hypothetical protein M422DRAFT_781107 [Sphaerobolus stellatus SS14]
MTSRQRRGPIKFFQEDVVRSKKAPYETGIVMRCWHDAEDYPPIPNPADPLLRPLVPGEIGVSFLPNHRREILPESEFDLVDRSFQPGDACKRDIQSVEAGVVISVDVEAQLEHAITGQHLDGWLSASDLEPANDLYIGDFVTVEDWIGQVLQIFDEAVVQLTSGGLVRVPQLGARLQVGDSGIDILPPAVDNPQSFLANLLRSNPQPGDKDIVLDVRPTVIAISWLAINQTLDPEEAAKRQRPVRFWSGSELHRLKLIRGHYDNKPRVGDKYVLKDPSYAAARGVLPSVHGQDGVDGGKVSVLVFMAKETRTRVKVLWQNGIIQDLEASALIPYLNVDEYDCWPGDYVLHKTEDSKRVAVVQSVNSTDRTALIRYHDTSTAELVSLLELDPHGTSTNDVAGPGLSESNYDGFGVRRGDFVFIHREGTTNGTVIPRVPKLGEMEAWVREVPHMVENADGTAALGGWRGELHMIGQTIARIRGTPDAFGRDLDGKVEKMTRDCNVDWFGEVLSLRTDGLVEVLLGTGDTKTFPLERLTRLTDPLEQPMDMWGDEYSDGYGEGDEEEGGLEIRYENGNEPAWVPYDPEVEAANDDWEDVDDWSSTSADIEMTPEIADAKDETKHDPMLVDKAGELFEHVAVSREDTSQTPTPIPATIPVKPVVPVASPLEASSAAQTPLPIDVPTRKTEISTEEEEPHWQRFAILPQAPADHAFYSSKHAQTSRAFMSRLNKEYRVLRSTLPDSILVRAYEDRVDLLRCLIIGPENTPYQDAPFVIDWLLDSDFPQTPPQAHFLSWTNGNGRVNPNLYEEGKVCLSILGTWAGDRNESWSAARSSLLQAFVSIQGLVLVKEPWFCEPAYEKLRNTEEGIVNSRLYNEKAYVLSRGFVRRALEIPLGGLEEEINWFYLEKGKLKDIITEARDLIEHSKTQETSSASTVAVPSERAVPRLTAGGALLLSRTLTKLDALWEVRNSSFTS